MNPTEREFGLDEAEQRIDAFLHASGLSCEIESDGDDYGVCLGRLYQGTTQICAGAGKGDMASARIGAKYEAMEHWLTHSWSTSQAALEPVSQLLADTSVCFHPLPMLEGQPVARLACRHFVDLNDGSSFAYPLALCVPGYDATPLDGDDVDYRALRRYASNSGTAIGGSVDEATLHALNECIERDAVSLFLLRHFYYRQSAPLLRINPMSLGPAAMAIHDYLQSHFHEVVLLDISNECGVTTCLAFFRASYDGPHIYGAGASIDPSHAAYRALAELLQLHRVTELGLSSKDEHMAQRALWDYPALYRSLMFNVDILLRSPMVAIASRVAPARSVREQIERIAAALIDRGLRVGACTLGIAESGLALVNVSVPAFERFFIVGEGHVVLPGTRGRAMMAEAA